MPLLLLTRALRLTTDTADDTADDTITKPRPLYDKCNTQPRAGSEASPEADVDDPDPRLLPVLDETSEAASWNEQTRLVRPLAAPLPRTDDGLQLQQPVSLGFSQDWSPTRDTVRLHFVTHDEKCAVAYQDTPQEPSPLQASPVALPHLPNELPASSASVPRQRLALCFHEDWQPASGPLQVQFGTDNAIHCSLAPAGECDIEVIGYGETRNPFFGICQMLLQRWLADQMHKLRAHYVAFATAAFFFLLLFPILLCSLGLPTSSSQWTFSQKEERLGPLEAPFDHLLPELYTIYPRALFPLVSPSLKEPLLILQPFEDLCQIRDEINAMCSYIVVFQDDDRPPPCKSKEYSDLLSRAEEAYHELVSKLQGWDPLWMKELLAHLEDLAVFFHQSTANHDDATTIQHVMHATKNHLSHVLACHKRFVKTVIDARYTLEEARRLEQQDILPMFHSTMRSTPTGPYKLIAADAFHYYQKVLVPRRQLILDRLQRAEDELASAAVILDHLGNMAVAADSWSKILSTQIDVDLQNRHTTTVIRSISWRPYVNGTHLVSCLEQAARLLKHQMDEAAEEYAVVDKQVPADANKRPPRPPEPIIEFEYTRGGWLEWLAGEAPPTNTEPLPTDHPLWESFEFFKNATFKFGFF
ncbi:hypothetical protein BGZ61DRAFT_454887 [Ilyonectria robusta]|uniref:uncharacterized protein n=1 Tax=Ilyonectria robusta TaxID=1079257 RepID=UPI001E8E0DE5|nr:uncharacterized protein BGZ61DRAFT_454887 [Ilyonectria robusta]KAH8685033.1 hypothetical protein BGZ61DRAFT_454887 [Ilyonectria robusta]